MAENEETEQPLNPDEDKTNAAADKGKRIVKKAAKKRAAKKKVVKKRVAAKKAVTKKIAAAPVSSSANNSIAEETAQLKAEAGVTEESSMEVDSVATNESSDAGQLGVEKAIPVAAEPHELPREEKVTMSVDASKAVKSSAGAGFWPKVILWVVVVLASFMYIRSLAHKGQTVKQDESPVPAALGLATGETSSSSRDENSSSTSTVASQSAGNGPSTVAKVGEVAIEKEPESAPPSVGTEPPSDVPVVPDQAVVGAEQSAAPGGQQSVVETANRVETEASPSVPELLSTHTSEPTTEPVAAAALESEPAQSADSASAPAGGEVAADSPSIPAEEGEAVAADSESIGADSQSGSIDSSSEIGVVGGQAAPQTTDIERSADDSAIQEAARVKSQESPEIATIPEDSVATAPATQNIGTPGTDGSTDIASGSGSGAVPQTTQGREYSTSSRRPTFKELFGYERPKPPLRRRDYGTQDPFSPDAFEQQRMYHPAPWQYAPAPPPVWGEYPGQYGPYGNFGGYPSYPNMPDWTPYQPYGYGPSGY